MKYLLPLFVAALLVSSCDTKSTTETTSTRNTEMKASPQLRHVVLLKFKESATESDIKKVEEAFIGLKSKIKEIKDLEWGINNSPEGLNKGFTHCFFLTFESEADRAIYLPHPDHKAFGDVLGPHLEDVTVVDYWAK
ncbi:MAG: Dabb family protein [Cyclobacteriaceae bacterium]